MSPDSPEGRLGRLEQGVARLEQRVDDLATDVRVMAPLIVQMAEQKLAMQHLQTEVHECSTSVSILRKDLADASSNVTSSGPLNAARASEPLDAAHGRPVRCPHDRRGVDRAADHCRAMSLRTAVVVLCVTLSLNVAVFAFWVFPRISDATVANCLRIHRLTGTLDQIIINGRASAIRYERDGTITRVQLKRALARTMWPGRSCTGRIARPAPHPR
jgi:hypothetical protein